MTAPENCGTSIWTNHGRFSWLFSCFGPFLIFPMKTRSQAGTFIYVGPNRLQPMTSMLGQSFQVGFKSFLMWGSFFGSSIPQMATICYNNMLQQCVKRPSLWNLHHITVITGAIAMSLCEVSHATAGTKGGNSKRHQMFSSLGMAAGEQCLWYQTH